MNSNTKWLGFAGGIAALAALVPTPAFAEAPSGADLLLPKMAEFIPALIAFLVIWFVLAKLAWPSILGMMEKRQQKIQDDLDAAANEKAAAEKEHREYQAQIAEARHEADEIVAKAKREAEAERSRILAKAQEDAAGTVDLSVEIASKIIGNDLSEADQRKLAEKYLAEVGTGHDNEA